MAAKTASFQEHLKKNILPELAKEFNLKNTLAVPTIEKIVVTVGVGTYVQQDKNLDPVIENVRLITGQKPIIRKSRMAVSNFKLRAGMPVGLKVTLRKKRMYDFLNKLINVTLPRVRDFRGISPRSMDGKGNISIGFKEFTTFLEINPDDVVKNHGIEVTIVTTAQDDESGYKLLKKIGFPFKKEAIKST